MSVQELKPYLRRGLGPLGFLNKTMQRKENTLRIVVGTGLITGLILSFILPYKYIYGDYFSTDNASKLGSYWSGIGAIILSAISIYLLYETYRKQSQELEETRKLVEKQTATLELSQEAAEEQLKTQRQQRFEQTFSSLLDILHRNINSDYKRTYLWSDNIKRQIDLSSDEEFKNFIAIYRTLSKESEIRNSYMIDQIIEYIKSHHKLNEPLYKSWLISSLPLTYKRLYTYMIAFECHEKALYALELYNEGIIDEDILSTLPTKIQDSIKTGINYTLPQEVTSVYVPRIIVSSRGRSSRFDF